MSFSYTFRKNDLPFEEWTRRLGEIIVAVQPGKAPEGTWREMRLSSLMRQNDRDDGNGFYAHYLVDGSIRGVYVGEEDGTVSILLRSFASRDDQYLAARLAWEAQQMGAEIEKGGYGTMDEGDFAPATIEQAHREWFALSKSASKGLGEGLLPIYDFLSLVLGPSDEHLEDIDLERKFVRSLARFGEAFPSSRMMAEIDRLGQKIVGVLQEDMPTLVTKDVELAALDGKFLALQPLVAALGNQALDGEGCWVLPPLREIDPTALQLATVLGSPLSSPGSSGDVGPSEEEWELISLGPVVAFIAVAGADGKIDEKEIAKFVGTLEALIAQAEYPVVSRMMGLALANLESIRQKIMEHEQGPIHLMQEFTRVVDARFPPDEGMHLKSGVFVLARNVAESSCGFFGFGPKISRKEKHTLGAIASLLGIV